MTPKEIKIGDKVLVEAEVNNFYNDGDIGCFTQYTAHDGGIYEARFDVLCSLVHKMTDSTAPKYYPCRLFRKGDKVRLVEYKGRHFNADAKRMYFCTGIVTFSECEHEYIDVCVSFGNSEENIEIDPAYLELIDPVEELEPYFVAYDDKFYHVHKKGEDAALAVYYETKHPHAKEAAQAECDRLNAAWKEQYEQAKSHE
jgi:hypothetical protein